MIEWIDYKAQRFPDDAQQQENFSRNHNSEYLLVIEQLLRGKQVLSTVPANLYFDTSEGDYYWEVIGSDCVAQPIKWALMPKPTED